MKQTKNKFKPNPQLEAFRNLTQNKFGNKQNLRRPPMNIRVRSFGGHK